MGRLDYAAKKPQMLYPKIYEVSIGLNIWDPVMRALVRTMASEALTFD